MRADRMMFKTTAVAVMMAAGIVAAGIVSADAATGVCARLEARLSSLQDGQNSRSGRQYASFDQAVNQQRREIDAANSDARRSGCRGGFLFFNAQPQPSCPALLRSIDRMQDNLGRLMTKRERNRVDPGELSRQRSSVLQQLSAKGCGQSYASVSTRPRGFFEQLFSPSEPPHYEAPPRPQVSRQETYRQGGYSQGFGRGSYRTLCVRTCDGYYFPISFATTRSNFASDEQSCQSQCPGTEVALYAHRNPGETSDDARSTADDTPYSDLPTAFAYRTGFNASCTCGKALSLDTIAGGYQPDDAIGAKSEAFGQQAVAPVPVAAPPTGEDPETLANRVGHLDPGEVGKPNMATPVAGLTPLPHGAVRRVGPSYYYAQ